jgi:hypothetical protein
MDSEAYAMWDCDENSTWTWQKWGEKTLSAGPHTLTLCEREDGAMVDKILIAHNLNYIPSGQGGEASLFWLLAGQAGPHGTIVPTDTLVANSGSTNFIITPDEYYFITNLTVNGVGQTPVANYTWTNVTADGTITVAFAQSVAVNNSTPHWWLAQNGLTNSGISFDEAETNDVDGDGFLAWEEFIAGTQPTNAGSYLKIDDVDGLISANGNIIQWQGLNTNAQYTIMWTTNLANELEALGSPQTPAAPAAQLIMTDSVHQTEGRIYYQLKVEPLP